MRWRPVTRLVGPSIFAASVTRPSVLSTWRGARAGRSGPMRSPPALPCGLPPDEDHVTPLADFDSRPERGEDIGAIAAHRSFRRLGFEASHVGFKLDIA